jgi:hypothetical protein
MSCNGFFPAGYKAFESLLNTDCTSAVNRNTRKDLSQYNRVKYRQGEEGKTETFSFPIKTMGAKTQNGGPHLSLILESWGSTHGHK